MGKLLMCVETSQNDQYTTKLIVNSLTQEHTKLALHFIFHYTSKEGLHILLIDKLKAPLDNNSGLP